MSVPIFVCCRDRVTPLRELVSWLEKAGHGDDIILLDNASTWPPLLEFYAETSHAVVPLGQNLGNKALWLWRTRVLIPSGRFVYTDPDQVPMDTTPLDMIEHLGELLDRYPWATKVGPGQYWADLPEPYYSSVLPELTALHSPANEVEPGVHNSLIDTTFALYRAGSTQFEMGNALRLDMPYMVRQSSLYAVELTEEDLYYCEHAILGAANGSSWAQDTLDKGLR